MHIFVTMMQNLQIINLSWLVSSIYISIYCSSLLFSLLLILGDSSENGSNSRKRFQRVEILKIAEPCPLIDPSQVVVTQGEILVADPVLTPIGTVDDVIMRVMCPFGVLTCQHYLYSHVFIVWRKVISLRRTPICIISFPICRKNPAKGSRSRTSA